MSHNRLSLSREIDEMYYEYLEIPAPPLELVEIDPIVVRSYRNIFIGVDKSYTMHECPSDLRVWLKGFFPDYDNFMYQTIRDGLPIHIDTGRPIAINLLLNTGGDHVETVWYEDDRSTVMEFIELEPFRWHKLKVDTYHTVRNITGIRLAITIY